MINRWMGDIALLIQAKTGVTSALIVWAAVVVIASLTAFIFLCVAGYDWLSLQWGAAFAGLAYGGCVLGNRIDWRHFCARHAAAPNTARCLHELHRHRG